MLVPVSVTLLPVVFLAGLIQKALAFRSRHVDMDGKPPISKALFASSKYAIVIVWGAMVIQIWGGGTTRARDLVDLLLISQYEHVDVSLLREAVRRVFLRRATHAVPERLPPPPAALAVAYRREARQVSAVAGLEEAHQLLAQWLAPELAENHRPG